MAEMNPATSLRSFVEVDAESHFPIQNLPFGVFRRDPHEEGRICTAIGHHILDLSRLESDGLLSVPGQNLPLFSESSLNRFMAQGKPVWRAVRNRLIELLSKDNPELRDARLLRSQVLIPQREVQLLLPAEIGDYTDFYSSREHATNVGMMFRGKENALMPNWLHLPVAYHGRASSVTVSGAPVIRPCGQMQAEEGALPVFGPSRSLDFELEMGALIGTGNQLGEAVPVNHAADHVFGMVLVNDWSARDIQRWEYVPLGPFLAKNFLTSISPWVVTLEALRPFRRTGPAQEPRPLPYLQCRGKWAFDIHLEVQLRTSRMEAPETICRSNSAYLYWNICQQIAHHTVNGCNLRTGDLLASGTISGPDPGSYGSLLELAWKGTRPLKLPGGEERSFLQDGDTVTMTGWCQGDGYRVGFGEVSGNILPASC